MPSFIPESLVPFLPWIFFASLAMFIGTLIAIPIVVARLPEDFFAKPRHAEPHPHPIIHALLVILRNLVGVVFLLAGIAMLFLPGQGLLTMLLGIALLDFPGKHALEEWIVRKRSIRRALNWLRRRAHKPPLRFPNGSAPESTPD